MERVLIVEDDENIRQLLKLTLASFNYELVDFENGQDAYDYLQNNKVDLAILDLMLPGMNGYDILKFIRSKATLKDLPVIILSAKDKELDKIMGLDLGADDYLTKPFSVLELAARIRSLLRRSKKDERLIQIHGLCIDLDKRTVTIHEEPVELTFKEFELLKYLAEINLHDDATILMVTHDPYTASFCNRILFIKDGAIFSEVVRQGSRKEFFNRVIDMQATIGGGGRANDF